MKTRTIPSEAQVTIEGISLTPSQVMAMRVAVSTFRMELTDTEHRKALGEYLATGYDDRLREVERLLVSGAKK